MSDNRNIISSENWVELYATLSNYILEYSSLDPIWIIDEDGNEVRTEEKQDEFIDIVDQVEAIMETVLIKESSNKIDQGDRKAMSNEIKTIMFGDFDKQTTETLSSIIDWELNEEGIEPYSYAFHIEVEYTTGEESDEV